MFFRDADRLQECRERLNECPLGSGAVAGTVVPLDRAAMARKLGFDRPTANSMDATSDRDFAIEFVQHAALLASHVSRLAEDLILFASREYGFVQLPDAYCTGSSAMPQKKNPDALELCRVSAARVLGNSVALLASLKGLPLAYNKDLQETQMPVFETTERMVATLESVTGCVGDLQFETERMRTASSRGGMNALAAAACLVRHGVPFRVAHDAVGKAVRLSLSRQCELEDLAEDDVRGCGIEVPWAKLQASLQLDAVLGLHDVAGGTAPGRVAEALANARARWALLREATHEGA